MVMINAEVTQKSRHIYSIFSFSLIVLHVTAFGVFLSPTNIATGIGRGWMAVALSLVPAKQRVI